MVAALGAVSKAACLVVKEDAQTRAHRVKLKADIGAQKNRHENRHAKRDNADMPALALFRDQIIKGGVAECRAGPSAERLGGYFPLPLAVGCRSRRGASARR